MNTGLDGRLAAGGIPVLRLHYTADPAKRPGTPAGDVWLAEQERGYPGGRASARWRREMEIEYGALSGEKLFPDWDLWRATGKIVIPPFDPVGYRLYGSYDHGWRSPAAFYVHGRSPDGESVTLWEFYAARVPVALIKRMLHGEDIVTPDGRRFPGCPFAGRLTWLRADRSIWAEDQHDSDAPNKSVAWLFRQPPHAVPMIPAERGGDLMIAEWLHGHFWADPAHPRHRITSACPNLLRELGRLRHKEYSVTRGLNQEQPEALVDKDDHGWDGLKYYLQKFPPEGQAPRPADTPASFLWWREQATRAQRGQPVASYARPALPAGMQRGEVG